MAGKSTYTEAMAGRILEHIALGGSLRSFCELPRTPSIVTVHAWLNGQPVFLKRYVRAREDSADSHAERIIDLTDKLEHETNLTEYCERILDALNDRSLDNGSDIKDLVYQLLKIAGRVTSARVNALFNAIRSYQWVAAKLKHQSYGDKLDVNQTVAFDDLTSAELHARLVSKLVEGGMERTQAIAFAEAQRANTH